MSRIDRGIVFVSAVIATAFVGLWLPPNNAPLRAGVTTLAFWVFAAPVFQWRNYWLLPIGALVAAGLSVVPALSHGIGWLVPVAIVCGLLVQFFRRRAVRPE